MAGSPTYFRAMARNDAWANRRPSRPRRPITTPRRSLSATPVEDGGLAWRVTDDRGAGGVWLERIGLVLLHLFQHQVHHRGQAHAMLSGSSVKPPQLDAFFIEDDRDPAADPGRFR